MRIGLNIVGHQLNRMFEHTFFDRYSLKDVPCHCDVYLMDEKWLKEYEASMLRTFEGNSYERPIGYISHAAVRHADEHGLDLSWYPNIHGDRFHEVRLWLPKSQIITCVGCRQYDEKPHIFVKSVWFEDLYRRPFSTFAFVDAIGVKNALRRERFDKEALADLRAGIDRIASQHSDVFFLSFSDSLILKSNWTVGAFDNDVPYTYEPEKVLRVIPEIAGTYKSVLGMSIYAVATQGANEYYDNTLQHISSEGNHVCMNSIGLPFAQMFAIDKAVKEAIDNDSHQPAELYLDSRLFDSLRFEHDFRKSDHLKFRYSAPMSEIDNYHYTTDLATVLGNIRSGIGRRRAQ